MMSMIDPESAALVAAVVVVLELGLVELHRPVHVTADLGDLVDTTGRGHVRHEHAVDHGQVEVAVGHVLEGARPRRTPLVLTGVGDHTGEAGVGEEVQRHLRQAPPVGLGAGGAHQQAGVDLEVLRAHHLGPGRRIGARLEVARRCGGEQRRSTRRCHRLLRLGHRGTTDAARSGKCQSEHRDGCSPACSLHVSRSVTQLARVIGV